MRQGSIALLVATGLLVACLSITQPGCTPNQRQAGAHTTAAAGGLLVLSPHPVAKIAGVVLIIVGETASLVLTFVDGDEERLILSPEDAEKAKKGVEVEFKDGEREKAPNVVIKGPS
jgi:hypothetical protein